MHYCSSQSIEYTLILSINQKFHHATRHWLIPEVISYIDSEKKKVVDQLQSGNKSKKDGYLTELPSAGVGKDVIKKLEDRKSKDVDCVHVSRQGYLEIFKRMQIQKQWQGHSLYGQ